jgi:hypothetical protein
MNTSVDSECRIATTTDTTTNINNGNIVVLTPTESEAAIGQFQEFLRFETVSATSPPSTGAYIRHVPNF